MGPSASFQSAGAYAPFRAPVQTYGQFGGAAMGAPQFGAPGGKQMFYDVYLFLTVVQVWPYANQVLLGTMEKTMCIFDGV